MLHGTQRERKNRCKIIHRRKLYNEIQSQIPQRGCDGKAPWNWFSHIWCICTTNRFRSSNPSSCTRESSDVLTTGYRGKFVVFFYSPAIFHPLVPTPPFFSGLFVRAEYRVLLLVEKLSSSNCPSPSPSPVVVHRRGIGCGGLFFY